MGVVQVHIMKVRINVNGRQVMAALGAKGVLDDDAFDWRSWGGLELWIPKQNEGSNFDEL